MADDKKTKLWVDHHLARYNGNSDAIKDIEIHHTQVHGAQSTADMRRHSDSLVNADSLGDTLASLGKKTGHKKAQRSAGVPDLAKALIPTKLRDKHNIDHKMFTESNKNIDVVVTPQDGIVGVCTFKTGAKQADAIMTKQRIKKALLGGPPTDQQDVFTGSNVKYKRHHPPDQSNHRDVSSYEKFNEQDVSEQDEQNESGKSLYHVYNRRDTNNAVVGRYSTLKRARAAVDKHDNKYGGYAHSIRRTVNGVIQKTLTEDQQSLEENTVAGRSIKTMTPTQLWDNHAVAHNIIMKGDKKHTGLALNIADRIEKHVKGKYGVFHHDDMMHHSDHAITKNKSPSVIRFMKKLRDRYRIGHEIFREQLSDNQNVIVEDSDWGQGTILDFNEQTQTIDIMFDHGIEKDLPLVGLDDIVFVTEAAGRIIYKGLPPGQNYVPPTPETAGGPESASAKRRARKQQEWEQDQAETKKREKAWKQSLPTSKTDKDLKEVVNTTYDHAYNDTLAILNSLLDKGAIIEFDDNSTYDVTPEIAEQLLNFYDTLDGDDQINFVNELFDSAAVFETFIDPDEE